MKNILLTLLLVVSIIGCKIKEENPPIQKYQEIITKYTEIKEIVSQEVDDTFYVYIRLPKNYSENLSQRYPVLYLLDGDISFNMAASIIRYLQFGEDIPDLIIVAPAYGTLLRDNETNFRERDYTISRIKRFERSGGGKDYLTFLKKELIPLIDSDYRTNNQRILNGYSLGGLFAINTLLSEPNLFESYIAGSPYLMNDLELLLRKSNELYELTSRKKLFVTVGELEDKEIYNNPINSLIQVLQKKKGLHVKFTEFENGTHFTCPSETLVYGLKFIFNGDHTTEP